MEKPLISQFIFKNNYKPWLVSLILWTFDVFSLLLSFFSAYLIRSLLILKLGGEINLGMIVPMLWMLIVVITVVFIFNGLYPGGGRTGVIELNLIIKIVTISFGILGLAFYVLGSGNQISRLVFIIAWFFSCIYISFFRLFLHNRGSLLSWWNQPILLVGSKKDVVETIGRFQIARRMALKPVCGLILNKDCQPEISNGIPLFPNSNELQTEIKKEGVQLAVFVSHTSKMDKFQKEQLYLLSLKFPNLIYVMDESPLSSLSMQTLDLDGHPALKVRYNLLNPWSKRIKRFVDLVICLVSLVFTLPLFIILALFIRIDSPGPILFVQKRMGKDGLVFDLFKFRTMVVDADAKLEALLKSDEKLSTEYRKYHKIQNDPRITRVGRFLRKTSLDEFPQIWNVFRGEMSLVGPRAYLPIEKEQMGESVQLIQRVLPGLTGWWQVMGRHDVTFQKRLKMDEYYISNFSLWMDFYILLKTVWVVIAGKGA